MSRLRGMLLLQEITEILQAETAATMIGHELVTIISSIIS